MTADDKKGIPTKPGRYYGRRTPGGPLEEIPDGERDRPADTWICRRLVDYAPAAIPAGAARGVCAVCQAPIAFNPKRAAEVPVGTPKVCMQCAGIEPLPIPNA